MKTRESGMPDEVLWESFFRPADILERLGFPTSGDVAEFGCGYGTFTIPAARRTTGIVYAFDIEPEMLAAVEAKTRVESLRNVRARLRDFVAEGTGLPDASTDYAMLFNILHAEQPEVLLQEAWRVLSPGGTLGIIHWNYDATTPRGPTIDIRPRPEQCRDWALAAGFMLAPPGILNLPPYHYGMAMRKPVGLESVIALSAEFPLARRR